MRHSIVSTVCLAAIAFTSIVLLAGCGGGGGGSSASNNSPTLSIPTVNYPTGWSNVGGDVTITTNITAPNGVKLAYATITDPSNVEKIVDMTTTDNTVYSAKYTVYESADTSSQFYTVVITVIDNNENIVTSQTEICQPGVTGPPAPPAITD